MNSLAKRIMDYIKARAAKEGVGFSLPLSIFEEAVSINAVIFGVHHDGNRMLRDDQEPEPGFFSRNNGEAVA